MSPIVVPHVECTLVVFSSMFSSKFLLISKSPIRSVSFAVSNSRDRFDIFFVSDATLAVSVLLLLGPTFRLFIF